MRRAERARKRRNRHLAAVAAIFVFLAVTATGSVVYAYNKLIESEENLDRAVEFAYGFVSEARAQGRPLRRLRRDAAWRCCAGPTATLDP